MRGFKIEHAAWAVLMATFVVVAALAFVFRGKAEQHFRSTEWDVRLRTAKECARTGEWDAARKIFEGLVREGPDREEVLLAYAEDLDERGEYPAAEEYYARAADTGRQRFSAVRRYAQFLDRRGRGVEAIARYQDYGTRHPGDYAARLDLGLRLFRAGQPQDAVPHLEAAAAHEPLAGPAMGALGRARAAMGDSEQAMAAWQRAVSEDPDRAGAVFWQDIANVYEEKEDWAKAVEAWEAFLASFPNSLTGVRGLQRAADRAGLRDQADGAARRLRTLLPAQAVPASGGSWVPCESATSALLSPFLEVEAAGVLVEGSELLLTLTLHVLENVETGPGLRVHFQAVQEGHGIQLLDAVPDLLGVPPWWRGDSIRQTFSIVGLDRLAPPWRLEAHCGEQETAVLLGEIVAREGMP